MCSVPAVLGYGLLVRMVPVLHMAFVVLGMMMDSISCFRQVDTGIHLEADKVKMQS